MNPRGGAREKRWDWQAKTGVAGDLALLPRSVLGTVHMPAGSALAHFTDEEMEVLSKQQDNLTVSMEREIDRAEERRAKSVPIAN